MEMVTYYRTPDGYVGLTGESPRRFRGIIFAGRGPKNGGPETVCEQGYAIGKDWVEVDAYEVPDKWFEAIGYEERSVPVAPEPEPERIRMEILFPWEEAKPLSKHKSNKAAWIGLAVCIYVTLWLLFEIVFA